MNSTDVGILLGDIANVDLNENSTDRRTLYSFLATCTPTQLVALSTQIAKLSTVVRLAATGESG